MSYLQEEEFEAKKVDINIWKKLLNYAKEYKKQMIALLFGVIILSVIDIALPYLVGYAIDNFITPGVWDGLVGFGIMYGGFVLISVVCVFIFIYFAGKVETGVCYSIRRDGFKRLQELSFSYYDKTAVGYMMARLTSDAVKLGETIAWSLVDLGWALCFMLVALSSMMYFNMKLALIMIASLPFLFFISYIFQVRILKYHRRARKLGSRITGAFNEGITGARTTKTLVREEQNNEEFVDLSGNLFKASLRASVLSAMYLPIVFTISALAIGGLLWVGGIEVQQHGIQLGELVFFISLAGFFFDPIYQIAAIMAEMQNSQAAAERVIMLLETTSDIVDSNEVIEKYGDAFNPKKENWPDIKGDVVFDDVTFQYKEGEKVLENFNLVIPSGQTVAIVGETGSGKSTIVNLVCRFYEPTTGTIYIDGVDYKERSQLWLHSNLGYVLQSPHLFSGSIMDNIRYGKIEATDEEVKTAAGIVGATHFIENMEKGFDSEVGEGGSMLSTGEKQLISFARAILSDPALFILDEATSSIDTETEMRIQKAIEELLSGRTSFIIAHRLSTIRHADRILVLDKGLVIEDGTHNELMDKHGHYYTLYTNQFKEERENTILGIENKNEDDGSD